MADKNIVAGQRLRDGSQELWLYIPIPANIRKAGAIPTPSSGVPAVCVLEWSTNKRALLDTGEAVFVRTTLPIDASLNGSGLVTRGQTWYDWWELCVLEQYAAHYKNFGSAIDSV